MGLNPHNFELRKNSEEKNNHSSIKYIKKKIRKFLVLFPSDTIFFRENSKKYDVIVGMFHDQVLALLSRHYYGFDAVNITMGLLLYRMSPDHGMCSIG